MEDYEILKKYFIDKERENLKLKEELNLLKSKLDSSTDLKLTKSQTLESRNVTDLLPRTHSDLNFNTSAIIDNPDNKNEESLTEKSNLATLSKSLILNKAKEKSSPILFNNGTSKEEPNLNLSTRLDLRQRTTTLPLRMKNSTSEVNFISNPSSTQNLFLNHNSSENNITPIVKNIHSTKEQRISFLPFDFEKNEDDSKGRNILIQSNKNVIRNIETNITELKKHLSSYETAYQNINLNLEINSNETEKSLTQKLDYINNELFLKIKLQEQEMKKIKEIYENELNIKNEIYEKNIFHLNQTHQEEVRKIRISYENKIDEVIKKSEEEKLQHDRKISQLENDVNKFNTIKKNESSEKNELIEFKKRYIDEMKELQKSFEKFKTKTYAEFKAVKKTKEEALDKATHYQELYEEFKSKNESLEQKLAETYKESKIILKKNSHLMNQLENSKSEFNTLKSKLEKIEKMLLNNNYMNSPNSNIITASSYKSIQFIQSEMNTLTKEENMKKEKDSASKLKHARQTSRCSDLVNYENIPNNKKINADVNKSQENYQKIKSKVEANVYDMPSASNYNSDYEEDLDTHDSKLNSKYFDKNTLEENLYRTVDLKKAHEKIKEMEESLKCMNDENENLKGKLGHVISKMNNLSVSQGYMSQRKYSHNAVNNMNNLNGIDLNENIQNGPNGDYHSNKLKISSANNSHKFSTKSSAQAMTKPKRGKNYSTEIFEDMQRQLECRENNNLEVDGKEKKFNSGKEKNTNEKNNGSIRNKLANSIQVSPFVYDENKKVMNFRDISPGEKRQESGKKNISNVSLMNKNESGKKTDNNDSIDEKIIEFPLQIKIKGKIRKIPTGERSPKASN